MSGQERDSQLSAMYDGELPAAECELLARRLSRDEALRREWGSYALIGAVIRGEPLAGQSSRSGRDDLAARVRAEIARSGATEGLATDDESGQSEAAALRGGAMSGPGARAPRLPRWAVPVSGVGIAAGVAAAAILWLRFDAPGPANAAGVVSSPVRAMPEEVVLPAPAPAPAPASVAGTVDPKSRAPDSYTVPPPSDAPAVLLGGAAFANFVVAHSEVATPLLRRNVISALVADPQARLEEIDAPPAGGSPPPASSGVASASGTVR
jgi:negative regulator of sigma E activity